MKKALILLIVGIFAMGLIGCSKKEEPTNAKGYKEVKIGYPSGGSDYIGGIGGVAQDKGYFEEELNKVGYTLKYFPFAGAGPAVNDAFVSGDINLVMYADFPGIVLKSKGVDISLLGVVSEEVNAQIIVKEDSSIKSLKDLKGKKIGFPKGTYVQKYLIEALASVGLKTTDVELVNMVADAESGLLTGAVDALASIDSLAQKLVYTDQKVRIISSTEDNEAWGGTSIFGGNKSYLKENPEVGTAMFKALLRAKEDAKKSPNEYYSQASKRGQTPVEAAKKLYNLDEGKFDYISLDISDKALKKINKAKEFLLKEKLISDDFDINSWVDNSYYKNALSQYTNK